MAPARKCAIWERVSSRLGLSSSFERTFINYVAHTMSTAFFWGGGEGVASLALAVVSTGLEDLCSYSNNGRDFLFFIVVFNQVLRLNGEDIKRSSDFCYLGSVVAEDGGASTDVNPLNTELNPICQ